MKVYLTGPMSGYPLHNFPAFDAAAAALRAAGHEVTNPAEIDRAHGFDPNDTLADGEYGLFLRRSLKAMLDCEAIAMLPGWKNSRGASLEFDVALAIGMSLAHIPRPQEQSA